jgi:hypothetical protein
MSNVFPVLLREHFAKKGAAQPSRQANQPSASSPSKAAHHPEKKTPEQKALDTFIKAASSSHGGDKAAAEKAEAKAKWAKAAEAFMDDEMRHSTYGMF